MNKRNMFFYEADAGGGSGGGAGAPPPAGTPPPPAGAAGAPPAKPAEPPHMGTPPPPAAGTPPAEKHWSETFDGLPKEVQGHTALRTYKSPADAIKGLVDVQPLIGADKVPLPKDWNDEKQVRAFNERIGVPTSPEKYEINLAKILPEGVKQNDNLVGWLQKQAFELGLRPDQTQKLAERYAKMQIEDAQAKSLAKESDVVGRLQAYQSELGDKYQSELAIARHAFDRFGNERFAALATREGLLKDPDFIRVWANIGRQLMEDHSNGDVPPGVDTTTPDGARLELENLKKDEAFQKALNDAGDPGHKAAVDRWLKVHQKIGPR